MNKWDKNLYGNKYILLLFFYNKIVPVVEKLTSGKRIFDVCTVGILSGICIPWTVIGVYVPVGFLT